MLAAVWHGPRDLRIEEMPEPEAGPGHIVLDVSRNGICGSDLHTFVGGERGGASLHVPGVVLGHEFAGTVRDVGDGVTDLAPGDRVAVAPIEYCNSCGSCRSGHPNTCRSVAIYGGYRAPLHGGLAARVAVSRRSAFVVPPNLSIADAALAEPTAVGVHAVRRAGPLEGRSVGIVGAGPIGLVIVAAVREAGASLVVASEPSSRRRGAAALLGAEVVIDPSETSLASVARELTSGDGVDVVFDTTAVSDAFNQGVRALRPRGVMVSVAGWSALASIDMGVAMAKEVEVRFTMTYEPMVDFPRALDLLSRRVVDPAVIVSDEIALADVVTHGLEELLHHNDRHLKILVDPGRV